MVYVLCVTYKYNDEGAHICHGAHVEVRGGRQVSCFVTLCLILLRQGVTEAHCFSYRCLVSVPWGSTCLSPLSSTGVTGTSLSMPDLWSDQVQDFMHTS